MRALLIDDEYMALEVLSHMLYTHKNINIVGKYTDPIKVLKDVKELRPNVIFLDIEMGDINGLEFAELLIREINDIEIVFTTAYAEYAVDAFELNAVDYLLKPIQEKRLSKSLERLRSKLGENTEVRKNFLRVNSFGAFEVIDSRNIALSWRTQKSKELFAYLWNEKSQAVSKMIIMEEIFPNRQPTKAKTLLHTTIYQMRKSLEKLGYTNAITYSNDSYKLDIQLKSDIDELNDILNLQNHDSNDIQKILTIYKGDFLEEEGYHWILEMKQKYKNIVFSILKKYAKKQLDERRISSVLKTTLDKLYKIDCFSEDVAKMMITYYGIQGRRGDLKDFFDNYTENIWNDMELKPMECTIDLYKKYIKNIR